MLHHILVPLDSSALAEIAIEETRRIVSGCTQITLLAVVQPPSTAIYDYELSIALAATYKSRLSESIARAKSYLQRVSTDLQLAGFKVDVIVKCGDDPAFVINKAARGSQVDAIVMSTHGRSGINRWLFGSVTSNVLSKATCPVFVVPSRLHERELAEAATENNYG